MNCVYGTIILLVHIIKFDYIQYIENIQWNVEYYLYYIHDIYLYTSMSIYSKSFKMPVCTL